ncbi:MAG: ABC transporter permease [Gemmatimonas sp.]
MNARDDERKHDRNTEREAGAEIENSNDANSFRIANQFAEGSIREHAKPIPPRNIPAAVRRLFRLPPSASQIDAELRDEFQFHIEGRIEQLIALGRSRAEAEQEVNEKFGDYETHWQHTRRIDEDTMQQTRRFEFWAMIRSELQRSARALLRTPGFTLIAILTLALGIGATTAIYTVVDAVVLRPMSYRQPNALVSILHPTAPPGSKEGKWGMSSGGYFEFKHKTKTLSDIGAYRTTSYTVVNNNTADVAQFAQVTASLFPTLRARAESGRLIQDADDKPGVPEVAVLSHEYFLRRFGGDRSIVGRNLETSSGIFQIVGVAEPGLTLPMPGPFASQSNLAGFGVDVWVPLQLNPAGPFYNSHQFVGMGRMRDGVTAEAAQRDLTEIASHFTETLSRAYSKSFIQTYNFRTEVSGLRNAVLGPTIPRALWMVMGSVLLVMLIAAGNVANLFIVRMESRRREAAVRTALGASPQHMAVHYLSESWLLCGIAGAVGLSLAVVGLRGLLVIIPASMPRIHNIALGWTSVSVALGIAVVMGTLLGLMPLLKHFNITALREGGRGLSASPRQRAVRNSLVVGQVALALVLLAAAGLMSQSFMHLRSVKPGFNPSNVIAFDMSLPFNEYDTREKALTFHRELQRQLLEIPGVVSAGTVSDMPLENFGNGCSVVFREGRPYPAGEPTPCVKTAVSGPGLFETLRIPVDGRIPSWRDIDSRSQAIVITKALADRLWPGESAIGKGINSYVDTTANDWYRVVGVVSDLRAGSLEAPPIEAVFYAPSGFRANRRDGSVNDLAYLVRTKTPASLTIMARVSQIVANMNPRVPVINARSMEQVVERSMSRTSFVMVLLGIAAIVALILSAVGMYGVISYLVAQRRPEIGIRIALGAGMAGVARLIVWQSIRLALVGVAIGVAGAYLLGKTMSSLLFGVTSGDPVTLAGVSALLLLVATAASLVPARRAARTDPLEAMRTD